MAMASSSLFLCKKLRFGIPPGWASRLFRPDGTVHGKGEVVTARRQPFSGLSIWRCDGTSREKLQEDL